MRCYCATFLSVILKLGRHSFALEHANRAIAASPSGEWQQRLRGYALNGLGRTREALESAREAVRLAPRLPAAIRACAEMELANGLVRDAERSADAFLKIAPEWSETYDTLDLVALKQKKPAEAEYYCREALRLNPNSYTSLNNMGVALLRQKKARESVNYFLEAAKKSPTKELPQKNLLGALGSLYLSNSTIILVAIFIVLPALISVSAGLSGGEPKLWIGGIGILSITVTVCLLIRRAHIRMLLAPIKQLLSTKTGRKAEAKAIGRLFVAVLISAGILFFAVGFSFSSTGYGAAPFLVILVIRTIVVVRKQRAQ